MQYQFVRKKQTIHRAVSNSDTLVDACVTVYPSHIDQGSPNFLGETTQAIAQQFEGLTSCVMLFSRDVTFYQINTFFVNI